MKTYQTSDILHNNNDNNNNNNNKTYTHLSLPLSGLTADDSYTSWTPCYGKVRNTDCETCILLWEFAILRGVFSDKAPNWPLGLSLIRLEGRPQSSVHISGQRSPQVCNLAQQQTQTRTLKAWPHSYFSLTQGAKEQRVLTRGSSLRGDPVVHARQKQTSERTQKNPKENRGEGTVIGLGPLRHFSCHLKSVVGAAELNAEVQ